MLPIVLHHGLLGFTNLNAGSVKFSYFHGIDHALVERGYSVIVPRVHPTAGVVTRARQLKEAILRQLDILPQSDDGRIVIIGHSMGGLDARYMISRLGMADRVAALLTISTPHHGSPFADWCVRNLGHRLGGLKLMRKLKLDVQAASDLTTECCRRFNEQVPDCSNVRYFSISAARPWHRVPPFALHSYKVISDAEGENDGLVSVKSAMWGTHLGTWPADHWHTINHRLVWEIKDPTGPIIPYYFQALDQLRAAGVDV